MESPLYIALSRADVLTRQLDMVANNIANTSTTGFKRQQMIFEMAPARPEPREQLDFVVDRSTVRDLTQGPLLQTGSEFDVALTGPGYLAVRSNTSGQTLYTRAGGMTLNENGELVDPMGNPMLSDGGDVLAIPSTAGEITIGRDGTVSGKNGAIGRLQLVEFAAPQRLIESENGYLRAEGQEPVAAERTTVIQGVIEQSNVRPVLEIAQMTEITRTYQSIQRLLEQEHERIRNMIRTVGKVA